MKRDALTFLFVCFVAGAVQADLAKMREIYESEVRRVGIDNRKALLQMPQDHIARLRDLEDSYRSAGDLPALLAVRKERERFIADPTMEGVVVVSEPDRLAALQRSYIENYAKTKADKGVDLKALTDKYLSALERLQMDLTRQNKIEEAVAVMEEVERMKASGPVEPEAPVGNADLLAEDPASPVSRPVAGSRGLSPRDISLSQLRSAISGKVLAWNSTTGDLTVEYDFGKPEQAKDWRGGSYDDIDAALVCDKETVKHALLFNSISRISFDVLFRGSSKRARLSLGTQLNAEVIDDGEQRAIVWQGSDQSPIVSRFDPLRSAIANRCELTLTEGEVGLAVNYGRAKGGRLNMRMASPVMVTLGFSGGECAFQRVKVTGILSAQATGFLSQRR